MCASSDCSWEHLRARQCKQHSRPGRRSQSPADGAAACPGRSRRRRCRWQPVAADWPPSAQCYAFWATIYCRNLVQGPLRAGNGVTKRLQQVGVEVARLEANAGIPCLPRSISARDMRGRGESERSTRHSLRKLSIDQDRRHPEHPYDQCLRVSYTWRRKACQHPGCKVIPPPACSF